MPSIQIKDVPPDTHAVLRERAARSRQSLQEYLLAKLIEEASAPTLDEVLQRIDTMSGGLISFDEAVEHVRAGRVDR